MATERRLQRRLAYAQPDLSLEPLSFGVDQIDHGHRRFAQAGGQLDDVVKGRLAIRVENARRPQRLQAVRFGP
ncbi:hypothetical protein D3C73_1586670 [compost metagenome]